MRRIRLFQPALWHELMPLLVLVGTVSLVVEAACGQRSTSGAPARSFTRSSSSASVSRNVTVTRGGSIASSPRLNGTRSSVRSASIPNPRATAPVINGTNVVNRVPGASRVGDGAPGVITGGFRGRYDRAGTSTPVLAGIRPPVAANGPAVPFGGITPNRGGVSINRGAGVAINPSRGWDYGPAVVGPSGADRNEPAIESSEWSRRYQERYSSGPYLNGGYNWGGYGPVFLDPAAPLYGQPLQNVYWGYTPPVFVGAFDAAPAPVWAEADEPDANGAVGDQREPVQRAEAPDNRHAGRRRPAPGIAPEKLHDLMIEGVTLFESGKYNDAASKFLRVTLADRRNIDATLAYAAARFATGDYQISGLAVRRAVRRMPEVVDSDFDLRNRYGDLHDFEVHLARLDAYLQEHPDDEDAWLVLGFVRHFSGQRDLAAQTFQKLKTLPRVDLQVAETFLAAKPADALGQTPPGEGAMKAPADWKPLLPGGDERDSTQELISVETAD